MKTPSKLEQKKRYHNALKQAAKINRLQKVNDLFLIWDDELVPKTGRFYLNENSLVWKNRPESNMAIVYFINNIELDNGMYDTIKNFNKQFNNIQVFKKANKKSIKDLYV